MPTYASTIGLTGITPIDYGPLIVGPLEQTTVALDRRISTTITTASHEFHVPVVRSDIGSAWVAEGSEISPDDAGFAEIVVTPAKAAGLTIISRELADDSSPAATQIVGDSLARSIAQQVDAAFFGNLGAPAPKGLGALPTSGSYSVSSVDAGTTYTSLDPFAEAIATSEQNGGRLTAFATSPATALAIAKLKTATGSNQPLLGTDATNGTARQALGVPIIVSPAIAAGVVWGIDASKVITVLRSDTRVELSRDVYFSSDRVGVRAVVRIGFAFPVVPTLVRIATTTSMQ